VCTPSPFKNHECLALNPTKMVSRFFSSAVGIDEDVIKNHIEYQKKSDKGQTQPTIEFK
jgi:hypothetical protein